MTSNGRLKVALFAASTLVVLGAAHVASAGLREEAPVFLDGIGMQGAMGSARNTSDTVQWIGCGIYVEGLDSPSAWCEGVHSNGTYRGCTTTRKSHIQAIASASNDSWIFFRVDSTGRCSSVEIQTRSSHPPKKL